MPPLRHAHDAPPSARQIDDALAVVHSPALIHDQPALRLSAWEVLMAERGHRVNTLRLSGMQYALRTHRGLGAHLLNPGAL